MYYPRLRFSRSYPIAKENKRKQYDLIKKKSISQSRTLSDIKSNESVQVHVVNFKEHSSQKSSKRSSIFQLKLISVFKWILKAWSITILNMSTFSGEISVGLGYGIPPWPKGLVYRHLINLKMQEFVQSTWNVVFKHFVTLCRNLRKRKQVFSE